MGLERTVTRTVLALTLAIGAEHLLIPPPVAVAAPENQQGSWVVDSYTYGGGISPYLDQQQHLVVPIIDRALYRVDASATCVPPRWTPYGQTSPVSFRVSGFRIGGEGRNMLTTVLDPLTGATAPILLSRGADRSVGVSYDFGTLGDATLTTQPIPIMPGREYRLITTDVREVAGRITYTSASNIVDIRPVTTPIAC